MRKTATTLLKKLTEAHGVPGHEDEVREIFTDELAGLGELGSDNTGSVYCDLGGRGPRVLVAGHMDEVGFRVQNITSGGFLKFLNVGGWWGHVLLAQSVTIKTASGKKIEGIVSSKPPHFLPDSERKQVLSLDKMFIDIGVRSREEAEALGIRLGDPIAPTSRFRPLGGKGRFASKAFDNRVGIAGAIQVAQTISAGKKSPNRLLAAGTTMEEVGLRGARTLAAKLKPDVAIVLECAPADDTIGFEADASQAGLGKGVQIRVHDPTAIMAPRLVDLCRELATKKKIPHQVAVRTSGGTDAGSFHLSNEGVPSIVLSTPARYIHSHHAILELDDYLGMVDLVVGLVGALNAKTVKKLTEFV